MSSSRVLWLGHQRPGLPSSNRIIIINDNLFGRFKYTISQFAGFVVAILTPAMIHFLMRIALLVNTYSTLRI